MVPPKGRPPMPVANATNSIGELAEHLRAARLQQGMTREGLAAVIGCSITTVQRAEGGKIPPTRDTLLGYVRVLTLDPARAETSWNRATNVYRGRTRPNYTPAPAPALVRTADELGAALTRLWEKNGSPSTREMERRTENRYPETGALLSRSTAERISRRQLLPGSARTLQAYLVACEVPETKFPVWIQAWTRVHDAKRQEAQVKTRTSTKMSQMRAPEAREAMEDAGLLTFDKYPGPVAPWSALHIRCGGVSRFRVAAVVKGAARCSVCNEQISREGAD